jgi:hypothetical protein
MLSLVPAEPPFGSRVRRLAVAFFAFRHSEDAELVGSANAMAAVVLGVLLWWRWDLSLAWTVGCTIASFVVLNALLLSRRTCWIPMLLGGLAISICPALALATGGHVYASTAGAWVGGALGLAVGLGLAFVCYRGLMKEMRRGRRGDD